MSFRSGGKAIAPILPAGKLSRTPSARTSTECIWTRTVSHFYAYGGDSGENHHDGSFCMNGLISPDRDVQPELYEIIFCKWSMKRRLPA